MTTLPHDYARCHGMRVPDPKLDGMLALMTLADPCRDCLRRTDSMSDNVLYSYFAAPEFTTTCPERIAP
jgi:hypothetical protein